MDSKELKLELERIWEEENVSCPSNLVIWRTDDFGYTDHSDKLTYTKGTRRT